MAECKICGKDFDDDGGRSRQAPNHVYGRGRHIVKGVAMVCPTCFKSMRMLGEYDSWDELRALAVDLRSHADAAEAAPAVPPPLASSVSGVVETARLFADALERVADAVRDGDIDLLRDELSTQPRALTAEVATAPRRLRSGNHLVGLYVTNAVAGCREALHLLSKVEEAFSSRVVALVAPAGCGKTNGARS